MSSDEAIELSFRGEGNYWGRSSDRLFIPGVDSNREDVLDSYPAATPNSWFMGIPPMGCRRNRDNCTLRITSSYADHTLTLDFELGSETQAYWDTFLVFRGQRIRLWSIFLRPTDPPRSVAITIPDFPQIGTIRFFTGLRTEQGYPCAYWATVDTGTPNTAPTNKELQELFLQYLP